MTLEVEGVVTPIHIVLRAVTGVTIGVTICDRPKLSVTM